MPKYYVYVLVDTSKPAVHGFSGTPFYVGKGQAERWKYHLRCKNRLNPGMNEYVGNMLNRQNMPMVEFVYRTDSETEAYEVETEWIHKLGRVKVGSGVLLNLTDGGAGTSSGEGHPFYGKTHTDDAKSRISDKVKGELNPFYGKEHSEETKSKMRNRVVSEQNKALLSELYTGTKLSESTKEKIRSNTPSGESSPHYGKHKSPEEKAQQAMKKAKYRYVIKSRYSEYIVFSLGVFCRANDLDARALSRSMGGKYSHKGLRMMEKTALPPDWYTDPLLLGEYIEFSQIYSEAPTK